MNRSGDLNLCTGGNNTLTTLLYFIGGTALFASSLFLLLKLYRRLQLSFAKHPTLQGHSPWIKTLFWRDPRGQQIAQYMR